VLRTTRLFHAQVITFTKQIILVLQSRGNPYTIKNIICKWNKKGTLYEDFRQSVVAFKKKIIKELKIYSNMFLEFLNSHKMICHHCGFILLVGDWMPWRGSITPTKTHCQIYGCNVNRHFYYGVGICHAPFSTIKMSRIRLWNAKKCSSVPTPSFCDGTFSSWGATSFLIKYIFTHAHA